MSVSDTVNYLYIAFQQERKLLCAYFLLYCI